MQKGDVYSIMLIVIGLAVWFFFVLRRHWQWPVWTKLPLEAQTGAPPQDIVNLLEEAGYEWVCGKVKIPISVDVNGKTMETRLFVDGVVKQDRHYYLIRLMRERKPMEWTGSSLREHLLVYHLLYKQMEGILVIDPKFRTITNVSFKIET